LPPASTAISVATGGMFSLLLSTRGEMDNTANRNQVARDYPSIIRSVRSHPLIDNLLAAVIPDLRRRTRAGGAP
jgi:hypothetical protein